MPATAASLAASLTGATHSMLATALLIVLPFAATMAATSPIAGVLRLIRSFIHRCPVLLSDKLKALSLKRLARGALLWQFLFFRAVFLRIVESVVHECH